MSDLVQRHCPREYGEPCMACKREDADFDDDSPWHGPCELAELQRVKVMNLRTFARNQPCTLRIAGVCQREKLKQSVLCHLSGFGGGSAKRNDDTNAIFACSACHDVLDGRTEITDPVYLHDWLAKKWWYNARALRETYGIVYRELTET